MDIVHSGLDGLDVAFQGSIPERMRALLTSARDAARDAMEPQYVEFGGVPGHVLETGAKGGYAFIFDTGPDNEIWFFKDSADPEQWNIRVSVRAVQVAVAGYHATKAALFDRMEAFRAKVLDESISRVDFAVDIVAPDFELRPDNFVCHSRCNVSEHSELDEGGSGFAVHYAARKATSVTVGKMPGRQVIVYDKRREAMRFGKSHWFDIWGLEKEDCPTVWRVEVRAGKKHLKDWRITTFEDLEQRLGDLYADAMQQVRIIEGEAGSNITRAAVHPLWALAAVTVADAMADHASGAEKGRIIEGRRDEYMTMLSQQITGLATSYAVAGGLTLGKAKDNLAAIVSENLQHYVKEQLTDFRRKYNRAEKRLYHLHGEPLRYGAVEGLS